MGEFDRPTGVEHGTVSGAQDHTNGLTIDMVKEVVDTYYHKVTRLTSNTLLRAKLGEALGKRKIAARSYQAAAEAEAHVSAAGVTRRR